MSTAQSIFDTSMAIGSTCAFAVPGAGPFIAGAFMGAQFIGDLIFGANADPKSLALTKTDLDQMKSDIIAAVQDTVWANDATTHFDNLLAINSTIALVISQPNGILGPFYAESAFPTTLAETNWNKQIDDFYRQLHNTDSDLRKAIAFAGDTNWAKYRFKTEPLYLSAASTYFILGRLYIAYALNACARANGLDKLKNDAKVQQYSKDYAAWKLGGKKGPEPTPPPAIPASYSQTVSPFVYEASTVASTFITYLNGLITDSATIATQVTTAQTTRAQQFGVNSKTINVYAGPPLGQFDQETRYFWQDAQTGTCGPDCLDQNGAQAGLDAAKSSAVADAGQAVLNTTPGVDTTQAYRDQLGGLVKNWSQAEQNCLDYIQTYPLPT